MTSEEQSEQFGRELKFRAWDKEKQEWIDAGEIFSNWDNTSYVGVATRVVKNDGSSTITFNSNGQIQWVQYTGLKDENGQEIWEGDVVIGYTRYENANDSYQWTRERPTVVKRTEKSGGFYPFTLGERWRCDVVVEEVIGNIFEHPHLLEQGEQTDE